MNRQWNIRNPNQGDRKKVLCVCSAGILRSPTMAWVLSSLPFNYNTRSAGVEKNFALIYADAVLCDWAELIVCAEHDNIQHIHEADKRNIVVLGIPDDYQAFDPELIDIIREKSTELLL